MNDTTRGAGMYVPHRHDELTQIVHRRVQEMLTLTHTCGYHHEDDKACIAQLLIEAGHTILEDTDHD